jgi:putative endonuclease
MFNSPQDIHKKLLGKKGEKIACVYLKKQGYEIIENNYKTLAGEADIIAAENDVLVFFEVKTRLTEKYGAPCEAVDYFKQKRYIKIALLYTQKHKLENTAIRFDVIEVFQDKINHIKGAFSA